MNDTVHKLRSKIDNQEALVGVIGLGYVGLPLALAFAESGFRILGFDVDQSKVDHLTYGQSYIHYIDPERIVKANEQGRLEATSDFARLGEPDAILTASRTCPM
jgi:UDP-N-acetyl-D-glucosamine dehydrogenase